MTMKTAIKGEQLIYLSTLNRSTYQQLFEESKKGQLQCPACSETVRLILGIEQDPYFQHISNKNTICQFDLSKREVAVTTESEQVVSGFRLPKAKSISTSSDNLQPFKSAKEINHIPTFTTSHKKKPVVHSSYIEALHKQNIYLDSNQIEAVKHPSGALLVLAGAGSGKTRVLTARTAYLLTEQCVEANRIMLVTFTAKAAKEMKERLFHLSFYS